MRYQVTHQSYKKMIRDKITNMPVMELIARITIAKKYRTMISRKCKYLSEFTRSHWLILTITNWSFPIFACAHKRHHKRCKKGILAINMSTSFAFWAIEFDAMKFVKHTMIYLF